MRPIQSHALALVQTLAVAPAGNFAVSRPSHYQFWVHRRLSI